MRVFTDGLILDKPNLVVAVDPGLSTMGVYAKDFVTGREVMFSVVSSDPNIMGASMAVTVASAGVLVNNAMSRLCAELGVQLSSRKVAVVMEQTTTAFQFSTGITACLAFWSALIEGTCGGVVCYVSNRITNFLLGKKTITASDSKKVVLNERPDLADMIKNNAGTRSSQYSHACDACLMAWSVFPELFKTKKTKRLELEFVNIWQLERKKKSKKKTKKQ